MEWTGTIDERDRQLGLDVPDADGINGECLLTLDARVWREELDNPAGVRVVVTIEPLSADEVEPALDPNTDARTSEQRPPAATPQEAP
jgi:hypothetical protein